MSTSYMVNECVNDALDHAIYNPFVHCDAQALGMQRYDCMCLAYQKMIPCYIDACSPIGAISQVCLEESVNLKWICDASPSACVVHFF
jgi:hypothetical protein